jgi:ion channel-forming bestrophin family protein
VSTRPHPTFFQKLWPPLPVWKRLDAAVLLVVAYTGAVEYTIQQLPFGMPKWIGELGVVNAVLLGVLLAFRNKAAYDRWWEARKLWGQLINDSRNLCLKAVALARPDPDDRVRLGRLVVGFAVALKNHLRGRRGLKYVPGFETDPADPRHAPAHLAGRVFGQLREWRAAGRISDIDYLTLDPHARALMDICGACERIKSTPVPLSYRALLRHGTILYLISAPWFLTGEYGYWAVAVVALLAYFLLGTEMTAEDVEDPFGRDGDDLELAAYCETVRKSAEEILDVDLSIGDMTTTGPEPPKNPPAK